MTEQDYEKESAEINYGARMKEFMDDEVVRSAMAGLERRYFESWKNAKTVEEREAVHARQMALEDIAQEMRTFHDRGKLAAHNRERRAAAEERQKERETRISRVR